MANKLQEAPFRIFHQAYESIKEKHRKDNKELSLPSYDLAIRSLHDDINALPKDDSEAVDSLKRAVIKASNIADEQVPPRKSWLLIFSYTPFYYDVNRKLPELLTILNGAQIAIDRCERKAFEEKLQPLIALIPTIKESLVLIVAIHAYIKRISEAQLLESVQATLKNLSETQLPSLHTALTHGARFVSNGGGAVSELSRGPLPSSSPSPQPARSTPKTPLAAVSEEKADILPVAAPFQVVPSTPAPALNGRRGQEFFADQSDRAADPLHALKEQFTKGIDKDTAKIETIILSLHKNMPENQFGLLKDLCQWHHAHKNTAVASDKGLVAKAVAYLLLFGNEGSATSSKHRKQFMTEALTGVDQELRPLLDRVRTFDLTAYHEQISQLAADKLKELALNIYHGFGSEWFLPSLEKSTPLAQYFKSIGTGTKSLSDLEGIQQGVTAAAQ